MTGAVVGSSSVVLSGTVVCVLFGFSVSGGMFVACCVEGCSCSVVTVGVESDLSPQAAKKDRQNAAQRSAITIFFIVKNLLSLFRSSSVLYDEISKMSIHFILKSLMCVFKFEIELRLDKNARGRYRGTRV